MKQFSRIVLCLLSLWMAGAFSACKDDEAPGEAPVVLYPSDVLKVDLNKAATPSIICVVNSAAGLQSVAFFIIRTDENGREIEEELDRPVTSFYNPHAYSVNQPTSFSKDMVRFKLVATDCAGRVTVSELPLEVIPIVGLPEVSFSTDAEGLQPVTAVTYVEDDPMPEIYVHVSSEENLSYLVLFQTTQAGTTQINDTIYFREGERTGVVNLKNRAGGETYVFDKGTTSVKAKVVAGELEKTREALLKVTYKFAVALTLDEDPEIYNGLRAGQTAGFSGTVASANPLNRFTYRMEARDGSILKDDTPIAIGSDGSFRESFEASVDLGAVVIEAENSAGKVNSRVLDVHVGYTYYYLYASLANAKNTDYSSGTGPVFSAELGGMFSFCEGKAKYMQMDVGFAIWNNNKNIKLNSLDVSSKFNAGDGNCSPVGTYADAWPGRNVYTVGLSSVAWADFDRATINDFRTEPIGVEGKEGTTLFKNMTTTPAPVSVAVYEAKIDGRPKRVLVAVDKVVNHVPKTPGNSTIMVKIKVEL